MTPERQPSHPFCCQDRCQHPLHEVETAWERKAASRLRAREAREIYPALRFVYACEKSSPEGMMFCVTRNCSIACQVALSL